MYEFNKFFLTFFVTSCVTVVHSAYRTSSELVEFIPIKPTGSLSCETVSEFCLDTSVFISW